MKYRIVVKVISSSRLLATATLSDIKAVAEEEPRSVAHRAEAIGGYYIKG